MSFLIRTASLVVWIAVTAASCLGQCGCPPIPDRQQRPAASPSKPPKLADVQKQVRAKIAASPLVFFVAKGRPDSCGIGCDAWIAIEGSFDQGATARFKTFLDRTGKRNLPVFFHSPGGLSNQGLAVGDILREKRMRAGVARTVPSECKGKDETTCADVKKSGREAEFDLVREGICASACGFAILGSPTREVGAEALLRVHSPLGFKEFTKSQQQRFLDLKHRYLAKNGVSAEMMKAALSVPYESFKNLTREEIFRFGIDKREFGDFGWNVQNSAGVVRLFRRGWTGDDNFGTFQLSLSCLPSGAVDLDYLVLAWTPVAGRRASLSSNSARTASR